MNTGVLKITRDHVAQPAPADYFTGAVQVTHLVQPTEPARAAAASVHFPAGARTAWHTHPLGQTLIVTAGSGFVQVFGEPAREITVGDVVSIPADVKHWHGAAPSSAMTHTAIQEVLNGSAAHWLEKVTDADYAQATQNARP